MSKKTQKQSIDKNSIIRIVATALVVVLIVSVAVAAFVKTAPKKFVDEDGNEHLLYIDEEGNTVLNNDGRIVVYATDADGDRIKDDNGEPMTNAIDFPQLVVKDNVLETPYYKMTMPEIWELQENGVYIYDGNEDITFEIYNYGKYEADAETLATSQMKLLLEMEDELKDEYPASSTTKSTGTITMKKIICSTVETVLAKTEDDIIRYCSKVYFVYNGNAYIAIFDCENSSYELIKDEFNLLDTLSANFATKDKLAD